MMTSLHPSDLAIRGVQSTNPFARIAHLLMGAAVARRERAQLADLDDAMLADIGLTREEALAEARRPLWDVPRHWRK